MSKPSTSTAVQHDEKAIKNLAPFYQIGKRMIAIFGGLPNGSLMPRAVFNNNPQAVFQLYRRNSFRI
jgi:hypothetical protein